MLTKNDIISKIKSILNNHGEVTKENMTLIEPEFCLDSNGFDNVAEDVAEIIDNLQDKLHRRNILVADLRQKIEQKDKEIADLKQQIKSLIYDILNIGEDNYGKTGIDECYKDAQRLKERYNA